MAWSNYYTPLFYIMYWLVFSRLEMRQWWRQRRGWLYTINSDLNFLFTNQGSSEHELSFLYHM